MRILLTTLIALVCAALLGLSAPAEAEAAPTQAEKRIIAQINKARAKHGLRKLKVGPRLQRNAKTWSRHLMRTGAFRHGRLPSGTGEVIAWGTCNWFNPARAVRAWLNSPSHRRLVLRPGLRFVGAGWTKGAWRGHGCVEMAVVRVR